MISIMAHPETFHPNFLPSVRVGVKDLDGSVAPYFVLELTYGPSDELFTLFLNRAQAYALRDGVAEAFAAIAEVEGS